ncbi:MAG TPA: hypothetical protein VM686_03435 [Polyangiaceae bacterium]|nr:hypothetical protein [Polyangiaceae bacterium]
MTSCSGPMEPGEGETGEVALAAGKPVKYNVTPTAEAGGSIAPSTVQQVSSGQSSVAFTSTPTTAAPNCYARNGFALDQNGDGVFESATATSATSYTFTNVTSNKGIRASFVPVGAYAATSSVESGTGSGTIGSHPASLCDGQSVTITLSPAPGSVVGDVKVNGVSVGNVNPVVLSNVHEAQSVVVRFDAQAVSVTAAITPLRNDAQGALSYTFDDGLIYPDIVRLKSYMDSSVYTNPSNPSDTGSYDLPVSYCVNTDDFQNMFTTPGELAAAFGNLATWATDSRNPIRVCSHSKTHPHLTPGVVQTELGTAARVLYNGVKASLSASQWDAAEPVGMAYPFNDWDAAVTAEVAKFHPIARVTDEFEINDAGDAYYAGEFTLLPGSPRYVNLHSCVWGVSRSCKAVSYPPSAGPSNNGNALGYVKAAIDNRKWMIFNFHTIEIDGQTTGSYGHLTEAQLKVFLDYAQQQTNAGTLFVEGLAEVGKYIKEAQASSVSSPVLAGDSLTFAVTHSLPDFAVSDENGNPLYTVEYNDPLTVKLQGVDSSWATATATQGGQPLNVSSVGGSLLVDGVVPNAGPVTVSK